MGGIVIFNHAAITHGPPEGRQTIEQSPALVQGVNKDGSLRLHVFGPFAHFGREGIQLVTAALQADPAAVAAPGTWQWPARA